MFVGIILNSNLKKVFYYKHLHYFSSNYYLYVIHLECLILWYIQFKFLMHVHPYRYFNRKNSSNQSINSKNYFLCSSKCLFYSPETCICSESRKKSKIVTKHVHTSITWTDITKLTSPWFNLFSEKSTYNFWKYIGIIKKNDYSNYHWIIQVFSISFCFWKIKFKIEKTFVLFGFFVFAKKNETRIIEIALLIFSFDWRVFFPF